MAKNQKVFNAKILLFGEYTVIFHSKALTIPYTYFTGKLSRIGLDKYTRYDKALESNRNIKEYLGFYRNNDILQNSVKLDESKLEQDLNNGLFFESNIPQGYGVGSSGALVAAIYDRYAEDPLRQFDSAGILKLKKIFADMESYFHGTSSGMDPLNCYIGKPLLVKDNGDIDMVKVPHSKNKGDGAIFLINAGFPGRTDTYVNLFLNKSRDPEYKKMIVNELIPLNNSGIEQITQGDLIAFFESLKELSSIQYNHFREMIPDQFHALWKAGMESNDYYLKLCGSGGGGFLLGFTKEFSLAKQIMKKRGLEIIPVFKNSHFRNP